MNLFTDDNPETTLHGLGFKNRMVALKSIDMIEEHFNQKFLEQKIPGMSPNNLRPQTYLADSHAALIFYQRQKMTRVIGLLNRAKSLVKRTRRPQKKKDFSQAIQVLLRWMDHYHNDPRLHQSK